MKPGFNWIDDLSPAARQAMLARATVRTFPGNVVLYAQGDITREIFQIASGTIRQYILTKDGAEVLVYLYGRGDVVADSAALDREPFPVNIATRGKTSLRAWPLPVFGALRRAYPEIDAALAVQMARRLRVILSRLADLSTLPARARIAGRLLSLVASTGTPKLAISQADLGLAVGASRQSVNEAVNELRRLEIISCRYGVIHVHDIAKLRRFQRQRLPQPRDPA